jgi:hypothetical protein
MLARLSRDSPTPLHHRLQTGQLAGRRAWPVQLGGLPGPRRGGWALHTGPVGLRSASILHSPAVERRALGASVFWCSVERSVAAMRAFSRHNADNYRLSRSPPVSRLRGGGGSRGSYVAGCRRGDAARIADGTRTRAVRVCLARLHPESGGLLGFGLQHLRAGGGRWPCLPGARPADAVREDRAAARACTTELTAHARRAAPGEGYSSCDADWRIHPRVLNTGHRRAHAATTHAGGQSAGACDDLQARSWCSRTTPPTWRKAPRT